MTDSRSDILERLKPLWEAVDKLGVKGSGSDLKAFLDEMWGEENETDAIVSKTENNPDWRDEDLAEDPALQFQMIAVAFATGRADEIDRVMDYIALIRRMKKQGRYDLSRSDEDSSAG
ncbi:hypothetical protein [Ruegeria sp. Ofav3-42]|uniref:hypothetical protein n=1 Tax=Ruegeria sp. Ofav3-42 TaxID=2917759 RepID=UPI001EF5366F|nr:hypothetical protein [Ruegeria sp. Ofav3-42]MCG7522784.1 hypothetical protein [Ruegeria sp. Ofav3-42]